MASFETLDSDYKAGQGCRGVGRLLWLKAFEAVNVHSVFTATEGQASSCTFTFTASQGVGNKVFLDVKPNSNPITTVHLTGFERAYREASPKQRPLLPTASLSTAFGTLYETAAHRKYY